MDEQSLIFQYQPLVHKFARRYSVKTNSLVQFDELVSVGNLALLKAIRKYVPGSGYFIGYASTIIVNSIMDYLRTVNPVTKHSNIYFQVPINDEISEIVSDPQADNPEASAIHNEQSIIWEFLEFFVGSEAAYILTGIYKDGKKPALIAKELDIPVCNVYYGRHKALVRLRRLSTYVSLEAGFIL